MTIGERIKELRTINGITQQELADSLHISRQSISKWEKNLVWPSFANVVAISDKFDVSLDEMIRGDEQFMESLEHRKVNTNIAKIIGFGIVIAVIAIILSAIIGFKEENLINVMSLIQAIAFLYMALNVNWRKINDSLSTKGIISAIIWFASLAIPQITDFVSGFINGMNH